MKHIRTFRTRTSDLDGSNYIKPYIFLDYFQDAANDQAVEYHVGFYDMKPQNMCWITMKIKFEVLSNPNPYEYLTIYTWPSSISNIDFIRDYEIKDSNNNTVCIGKSQWCIGRMDNHRIIRTNVLPFPDDVYEESVFEGEFNKLVPFDITGLTPSYEYKISLDDYDLNNHTNNVRYGIMIYKAINLSFDEHVKTFEINYHREVKVDDVIEIYFKKEGKNIKGAGIIKDTGVCSFDFEISLF